MPITSYTAYASALRQIRDHGRVRDLPLEVGYVPGEGKAFPAQTGDPGRDGQLSTAVRTVPLCTSVLEAELCAKDWITLIDAEHGYVLTEYGRDALLMCEAIERVPGRGRR